MKTKWYDFGLEFSLLSAVVLTPLLFAPQLNVTFEFIKIAVFRSLTLIAFIFFVVKISRDNRIGFPVLPKWLWVVFAGYFAVVLLSALMSDSLLLSFWGEYFRLSGAYTFLHYGLFFLLLITSVQNKKRFLHTAFWTGTAVAILGILQYSVSGFMDFWDTDRFLGRIFSTMGHPNYLASFLIMLIPLGFAFYLKNKRWLFLIGVCVMSVCLFLTLSRSAFIGLMIGGLFFLSRVVRNRKIFQRLLSVPILILIIVGSVNLMGQNAFIRDVPILNRLVFTGENMRSLETRTAIWPAAIDQISKRLFFGYGPATFENTFPRFAPADLSLLEDLNSRADRVHNEILDTLVTIGIVGLVFYLAIFAGIFIIGTRKKDLVATGLLSGILALFVANQFGFSLVTHYMYFWLFIALILSEGKRLEVKLQLKNISKALILIFVAAGTGYMIFFHNIKLIQADYYFRQWDFEKAAEIYPMQSYYSFNCANLAIELDKDASECLENAGKYTGYNDRYYFNLARFKARKGENFEDAFEKAHKLAPNYPYTFYEWGVALYKIGEYERAIEKFEKYLSIVPSYWKWRLDLDERSYEEQKKYRIFYKLNPSFNDVFPYLAGAYAESGDAEKALYYGQFSVD